MEDFDNKEQNLVLDGGLKNKSLPRDPLIPSHSEWVHLAGPKGLSSQAWLVLRMRW